MGCFYFLYNGLEFKPCSVLRIPICCRLTRIGTEVTEQSYGAGAGSAGGASPVPSPGVVHVAEAA